MPQDFKVTDVVSKEAMDSLIALKEEGDKATETFAKLIKELGGLTKIKVNNITELADKLKQLNEKSISVEEADRKLIQVQEEYNKKLKETIKQVNEEAAGLVAKAKVRDLDSAAALKAAKIETERIKGQQLLTRQTKQLALSEAEITQIMNTQAKSINQAKEQNKQLSKSVQAVVIEDEAAIKRVQELNAKIDENTAFIKRNSDAYTKQKMTIGDYRTEVKAALSELSAGKNIVGNLGAVLSSGGNIIMASVLLLSKLLPSLSEISDYISEGLKMASAGEGIKTAFDKIADIGTLQSLRKETKGLISDLDLYSATVNANNFNVPIDKLGTLLKFAQQRAQETGQSVDYLADSIITGIGRKSPLILDNLGISAVRLREETKKTGDFASAAINIVNEELSKQGDLAETTAERETKAAIKRQNAQMSLGQKILWLKDIWSKFSSATSSFFSDIFEKYYPPIQKGLQDIINYFIELYNKSFLVRYIVQGIINVFVNLFELLKLGINITITLLKHFGEGLKAILTLDFKGFGEAYKKAMTTLVTDTATAFRKIVDNYKKGIDEVKNGQIEPVNFDVTATAIEGGKGKTQAEIDSENAAKLEAQEKLQEKLLKIRETYQQSELDLMDDGLAKELKKIKNAWEKRIAEVKGYSEEEIQTRKNYAALMQTEIADKTLSYGLEKEKKNIDNRLSFVKKNSEEERDLRIQALNIQELQETQAAEKTGEDVSLIESKYQKKRQEEYEKYASAMLKKIADDYAMRSILATQSMNEELAALSKEYANGIISEEQYEKEKADIAQKYALQTKDNAIEAIEEQLKVANLSAEERESLEKKLAEVQIALSNAVAEVEIKNNDDVRKSAKDKYKEIAEALQMVGDVAGYVNDFMGALTEKEMQRIDEQSEASEKASQEEMERIQRLEESGIITKEEAEARKRAAEDRTRQTEKQLEEQRKKAQIKQAQFNKANSIAQIAINTAVAITKTLADGGAILGIPLVPLIAGLGAIQLAAAIAQPIPKYAKGTKSHPGGLAIVGDAFTPETVISHGKAFLTPSVPTLALIDKGAEIIPRGLTSDEVRKMGLSDLMYMQGIRAKEHDNTPVVNVYNDYSALEGKMELNNKLLARSIKMQNKYNFSHLAKSYK
ncbi:hypothetical protein EZS27_003888 [termite gut metagenome]|uniref:Uncharacterized protein n=1 Tax=termite gut metagenome TaxID=433724 RepID=A0A5J4SU12_9ZZZZ